MKDINCIKPDMKEYYNFRSSVYNLYDNDTYYGDLCGSVLHIRDKNKCINSMSTCIQKDHYISIEFDESTDINKMEKISSQISDKIKEFIENNCEKVNLNKEIVEKYVSSKYSHFCDQAIVGNTLTIML